MVAGFPGKICYIPIMDGIGISTASTLRLRWNPTLRIMVVGMVFAATLWLLNALRSLIAPVIIAVLLAYLLNPIIKGIRSWTRLHHAFAVTLVYILFVFIVIAITGKFVPLVISQANALITFLNNIGPQVENLFNQAAHSLNLDLALQPILIQASPGLLQLLNPERIFGMIQATGTRLAWLLIIIVTTFYLMLDWEKIQRRFLNIFPDMYRPDVLHIEDKVSEVWQAYFRGQLTLMMSVGVLSGIGAALIGLPLAALFGLIAGLMDLVPNIGPTITLVLAAVVALFSGSAHLQVSNVTFMFITIAVFELIQMLENFVLQPNIVGHSLKIHPGIVFVIVFSTIALGNPLIVLVIVPTAVSLGIILKYVRSMLLDEEPFVEDTP